jgi:hypothetical protein
MKKTESAISEIVGAILLVALVIAGIGIVSVVMTSTSPPQTKEKAVLSSSCIDCSGDSFVIVVRHEGGEAIDPQSLKFWLRTEYANGTPFERIEARGTDFCPAEHFSALSRGDVCFNRDPDELLKTHILGVIFNKSTSMTNGDAVTIWYYMKNT